MLTGKRQVVISLLEIHCDSEGVRESYIELHSDEPTRFDNPTPTNDGSEPLVRFRTYITDDEGEHIDNPNGWVNVYSRWGII